MRTTLPIVLLLAGCHGYRATAPVVYGPYPNDTQDALFERVHGAIVARGRSIELEDRAAGRIVVRSSYRGRAGQDAHIVVQLFQGNWVQVSVEGSSVRMEGAEMTLPGPLQEEYEGLAVGLIEEAP